MKVALAIAGTLAIILGTIGIFLPLLPTTPFLLLAAACYVRVSPRLYNWLISQKYLGSYIRNYREKNGITLKAKLISIVVLWATIGLSVFKLPDIYIRLFLLLVGIGVTIHLIKIKTLSQLEGKCSVLCPPLQPE